MKTINASVLVLSVAVCVFLLACGGGGGSSSHSAPAPTLTALQVTPTPVSVPLGGTKRLALKGVYSDGSTKDYSGTATWTSSDTNVALVDSVGNVTAKTMGSAKISATASSMNASSDVTVCVAEVTKIDIGPSATSTPANTVQKYIAYGTYSDGTVRDVTKLINWSSSDETVVKIASPGIANALKVGTSTLTGSLDTANLGKVSSTAVLTVTGERLAYIAVIPYQPVVGAGTYQSFTALGQFGTDYTNHTLVSVAWSESSGGTVSSIDAASGMAHAIAPGRTRITATFDGVSDTVDLSVLSAGLISIEVIPSAAKIAKGTRQQFQALGTLQDGSTQLLENVSWTSDRTDVATIDANGLATGVASGDTKITAKLGISSTPGALKVTAANLVSIEVKPQNPQMPLTDRKQFFATGAFDDGTEQDLTQEVTWLSTKPAVAQITAAGVANSLNIKNDSTRIAAVLGPVTGSTILSTSGETIESVAVSPVTLNVPRGLKLRYTLAGTSSPSGNIREFELPKWWTSPISIATADANGIVTSRALDGVHTIGNAKVWGESCCRNQYTDLAVNNAEIVSLSITWDAADMQMHARAHFNDGSNEPTGWDVTNAVHWTSSAPLVATIDRSGLVKPLSAGTTSVTATFYPVPGSTAQATATPMTLTIAPR